MWARKKDGWKENVLLLWVWVLGSSRPYSLSARNEKSYSAGGKNALGERERGKALMRKSPCGLGVDAPFCILRTANPACELSGFVSSDEVRFSQHTSGQVRLIFQPERALSPAHGDLPDVSLGTSFWGSIKEL
jgi:hypothetical protein